MNTSGRAAKLVLWPIGLAAIAVPPSALSLVTKSGEEYSGVLRRDATDEVLLATGPNAETPIARANIAEMRPGTVSVMPAGMDEQLTRQDLADLVTFLKGTKWGAQ